MKILAIALLCVWVRGAVAQEERAIDNFAGVGVRAMGMGGAFVGVADDFTAMYWNPAGLAQMQQREVQVSFLRNSRANDSVFNGTAGRSELTNTRFGSLGFVYPYPVYRGSLVLAAGFNRIKDFDWNLKLTGEVKGEGQEGLAADQFFQHEGELGLWGVSTAVDVSPALSLGLTLGFTSGEDQNANKENLTDPQNKYYEQRLFVSDTVAYEYQWTPYAIFGAMIRTPRDKPRYRLGATFAAGGAHKIRSELTGPFSEGEIDPCNPDSFLGDNYGLIECDDGTRGEFPDGNEASTYELSLPFEFGIGASAEALPGLTLAGSLHLAEWSQSEYKLSTDTSFETQYRDVLRYHFGVEYQVPIMALDLRAGYYADPLPFIGPRDPAPDSNDPPIHIEKDRRFVTLGAGLLLDEAIQVDLAWVRGGSKQEEKESEDLISEEHTINRLVVSVGYNF